MAVDILRYIGQVIQTPGLDGSDLIPLQNGRVAMEKDMVDQIFYQLREGHKDAATPSYLKDLEPTEHFQKGWELTTDVLLARAGLGEEVPPHNLTPHEIKDFESEGWSIAYIPQIISGSDLTPLRRLCTFSISGNLSQFDIAGTVENEGFQSGWVLARTRPIYDFDSRDTVDSLSKSMGKSGSSLPTFNTDMYLRAVDNLLGIEDVHNRQIVTSSKFRGINPIFTANFNDNSTHIYATKDIGNYAHTLVREIVPLNRGTTSI